MGECEVYAMKPRLKKENLEVDENGNLRKKGFLSGISNFGYYYKSYIIVIAVDTTLTGTTSVDFALTVNSEAGEANDLTVNSPTTAFNGNVGALAGGALGTLTTDTAGTTTINAVRAGSVTGVGS